ncbi:pyrroloquinoline quinone biosynthesis protein PqqE [Ktedonosporobacter rubrisoli]|uniref:PqqA peptide cyclase n=1 Tax=Ktedonosporobacter rubrisoli TaxID=2509675 RepID=A0A4P6JQI3_KTERU|nr:pyrroloquinoline quinone biosynthesis protein PqqE [Ktedonosporobacter rubrisoli]QBD77402.1 pyrroloquinoline quinone biosynthesis protein PqqE [Ktedonosporobacter rubrisoli]
MIHTQQEQNTYRPFGLLAEVTYRCPLHCPYCSNPIQFTQTHDELSTDEWVRVIAEARELGVLHLHFSGGEPLLRKDLSLMISHAHAAGLYTNLITSARGLTYQRLLVLQAAGLDTVQISFQADEASLGNIIAGANAHAYKLEAARMVRALDLPLTINVVLHRANLERLEQIIHLAEELDAQRLELAHTQYLGWAFQNREMLMPTSAQVAKATAIAADAQVRLRGKMEVLYIKPDYYSDRPKPCMYGWGRRFLTVNPQGDVLPCQTASVIPSLRFENVRQQSLSRIWHESEAFQRFRGTEWMPEPCRSCALREVDFGGCRCQAFLLTGDAAQTDPVCSLSPHHEKLTSLLANIQPVNSAAGFCALSIRYRTNPT